MVTFEFTPLGRAGGITTFQAETESVAIASMRGRGHGWLVNLLTGLTTLL